MTTETPADSGITYSREGIATIRGSTYRIGGHGEEGEAETRRAIAAAAIVLADALDALATTGPQALDYGTGKLGATVPRADHEAVGEMWSSICEMSTTLYHAAPPGDLDVPRITRGAIGDRMYDLTAASCLHSNQVATARLVAAWIRAALAESRAS